MVHNRENDIRVINLPASVEHHHRSSQKYQTLLVFFTLLVTGCHQYELRVVDRYADDHSVKCHCNHCHQNVATCIQPLRAQPKMSQVSYQSELNDPRANPGQTQFNPGSQVSQTVAMDRQHPAARLKSANPPQLMANPPELQPASDTAHASNAQAEGINPQPNTTSAQYRPSQQPVQSTSAVAPTATLAVPVDQSPNQPGQTGQVVYQQPIEFRAEAVNQPPSKLATERLLEVLDENEKLKVMLTECERKSQALEIELIEARQTIISANHTVSATVLRIDELNRKISDRNAQIEQMHSLIREHESITAARLQRLTNSVRRSVQEGSSPKRIKIPPAPNSEPNNTVPATPRPPSLLPTPDTTFPERVPPQANARTGNKIQVASLPVIIGKKSRTAALGKPEIDTGLTLTGQAQDSMPNYLESDLQPAREYPGVSIKADTTSSSKSKFETSRKFAPTQVRSGSSGEVGGGK